MGWVYDFLRYPFLGISKSYAFTYFATPEQALKAKEDLNHYLLLRKHLRITTLTPYDKEANLFFMGFAPEASLKEVEVFFGEHGPVVCIQFSYDDNNQSRGYGWVQFQTKADADKVVELSKNEELHYKGVAIKVHPFLKKGKGRGLGG